MSILKIKDGQGNWVSVPTIKGETGPKGETGSKGDKGETGDTGAKGKSAYEVAVDNGYVGTEEQWLASLIGAKGDTGATGPAGVGVPTGGTAGQVLAKNSATNYDTTWIDVSGGGGDSDLFVLSGVYGSGAWTFSHTFREVYNATQEGKNVIGVFINGDKTNIICRLSYRSMDYLIFKPDLTIEARYQPGYDYVLNNASYFYKSDNTLSVSSDDISIPTVPETFFGLKLYCDGSSEYQDNPSGTFTVVDPASMFSDMGQFRDQRPDSFMLIYGNSDSSEYGYYEMYHLHDITVSAGSTEGEGSDNIMVAFQTISMHSGSPILKRVTISGEMYTWVGLDEATITYTATAL